MAFDPFSEEQVRLKPTGHELGQDLSLLSIHEARRADRTAGRGDRDG